MTDTACKTVSRETVLIVSPPCTFVNEKNTTINIHYQCFFCTTHTNILYISHKGYVFPVQRNMDSSICDNFFYFIYCILTSFMLFFSQNFCRLLEDPLYAQIRRFDFMRFSGSVLICLPEYTNPTYPHGRNPRRRGYPAG